MAYADQVDALTTAAVRQLRADLALVVQRLRAELALRLELAHVDGSGRLVSDDWNAELAAKLEADLSRLLEAVGYDGAIGRLRTTFEAVQEAQFGHLALREAARRRGTRARSRPAPGRVPAPRRAP